MRAFVGVPVDDGVKNAARAIIDELGKTGADVKWVKAENMHVTLVFLGDTPESNLQKIKTALAGTAKGHGAVELTFERLGAFGAPSRPKIIWLGIGAGAKALTELSNDLVKKLAENGIVNGDKEKHEFTAHLTLGRVRGPRAVAALADKLTGIAVPNGLSCLVDRLVLYQSHLSGQGSDYKALHHEMLG